MKLLRNAPKVKQSIPAGSIKKREPSKKHLKNKLKSSNRKVYKLKKCMLKLGNLSNFMVKVKV